MESSRVQIWVLSGAFRGNCLGGLKKHEVRTLGFPAEFRAGYFPNRGLFRLHFVTAPCDCERSTEWARCI